MVVHRIRPLKGRQNCINGDVELRLMQGKLDLILKVLTDFVGLDKSLLDCEVHQDSDEAKPLSKS